MKLAKTFAAVLAIGLASCVSASAPNGVNCDSGPCVAIGETELVRETVVRYRDDCPPEMCARCFTSSDGSKTIKVTPLAVLVDKRCPLDDAGECWKTDEFRLRVRIDTGRKVRTAVLEEPGSLAVEGGRLSLEIAPEKASHADDIPQADYRFDFTFLTEVE